MLDDPVGYIAGTGSDTAVVIFPIVRRQSEELALGYVAARLFECAFILVGILAVLAIVTLRPGWVVGWGNELILG